MSLFNGNNLLLFKVKKEYDQCLIGNGDNEAGVVFADELFTFEELEAYHIPAHFVYPVEVPPDKVYWSFGSRLESEE